MVDNMKQEEGFTLPVPGVPGLRNMADVESEPVEFIWFPYLPRAKLIMLEGDPGLGKSWISMDIASRLSTGEPWPEERERRAPARVLMLSAEDGLGDTLRPRLEALGANMSMIFASEEGFTLSPEGLKKLESTMAQTAAAIVFLDPIVGYMGGKIDMHRQNEVRELMSAMAQVARRTGASIIGVRHLRKAGTQGRQGRSIYDGIGSIDFTAAARSVLQVGQLKDGSTYMAHIKHNLSAEGRALGYRVNEGHFEWSGQVDWGVAEVSRGRKTSTVPRVDVGGTLFGILRDGPQPAARVIELALAAGISMARLQKEKLEYVVSTKEGKGWMWTLKEREGM